MDVAFTIDETFFGEYRDTASDIYLGMKFRLAKALTLLPYLSFAPQDRPVIKRLVFRSDTHLRINVCLGISYV